MADTVVRLEHLADATAQAISAQVDVISEMAERAKLLALNAGIEAACAGESGRGFSVIAGELHRLASGSKSAGEEVASLVDNVVAETQSLVKNARVASEVARGAIERATQTGSATTRKAHVISGRSPANRPSGRQKSNLRRTTCLTWQVRRRRRLRRLATSLARYAVRSAMRPRWPRK